MTWTEEESVNSAHPVLKNTGGNIIPSGVFVAKTWSRGFSRLFPPEGSTPQAILVRPRLRSLFDQGFLSDKGRFLDRDSLLGKSQTLLADIYDYGIA